MPTSSQLESIFFAALEKQSPAERKSFLDEVCAGDDELHHRVERMLTAQAQAGSFLESPAAELAVTTDFPPISEQPGTVIGPYKLLQQIGEGGMGVVFMAEQTEPIRRTVALKIIKPGMDTRQVIARFEAERQALAMMDHPNIAKVLDAGTTADRLEPAAQAREETPLARASGFGRPYFVMDLVKGVPITDYCDQQHLPVRARLELVSAVCHAVQHAHQKGIIHRDLKPSNVLVAEFDGKPVPKIIDFGVAKATAQRLTEKTMFTELGQMVGTVEYMSPEQARFNQLDIDTRSDIYSLGVLLYEILAGSTPFGRKRLHEAAFDEMLRIIREEEPPKPSTRLSSSDTLSSIAANRSLEPVKLNRLVQGELDWIVMKALEKDRDRRYETASSLAADIGRHLNDEPVSARPASSLYRFRKTVRRNKIAFAAGSAVVAALIVGLGLSTWLFVRERAARQRAVAAERLAEIDNQKAKTEATKSELVAQFMTDMLKGVGPSVALGRDTTMLREILDQTAVRLSELHDQPAVEAELRATLGKVYCDLAQYNSAEAMYRESLALRRRIFDNDHPAVADALDGLAEVLNWQDNATDAETAAREALDIRQRVLGDQHPDVAISINNLAYTVRRRGRLGEAETLSRQGLALTRELLGSDHPEVAEALNHYGELLMEVGEYAEAEATQREALAVYRKHFTGDHPEVAKTLHGLGDVLARQGKYADAEAVQREAIAIQRKTFGNGNHRLALGLLGLSKTLLSEERYDEAEALVREALAMQRKVFGNHDQRLDYAFLMIGRVLSAQGKLDELESIWREELAARRKLYGDQHVAVTAMLNGVADTLRSDKRKHQEAEALYRECLAIHRKVLGNEHNEAKTLQKLGSLVKDQGRLDEAEELYREALTIQRSLLGAADPTLANTVKSLADLLSRRGEFSEAEALFRESLAIQRKSFGNEHPLLARPLLNLASTLHAEGKLAEALPIYREALALLKENKLVNHKVLRGTINGVAWTLAAHPKPDLRDGDLAVELALQAVAMAPNDGKIRNTLGVAYYRVGDWSMAAQTLNEAMNLRKGGDSFDWFFLAMANWQMGHQDEARKCYEQAMDWMEKHNPSNDQLRRFRAEAAELLGITDSKPAPEPVLLRDETPNSNNPSSPPTANK